MVFNMVDFESSKEQIANLVDEFKANEHYFKSVSFDEENTKINFINKFFIALGWDVYNDAGVAPQYKDVEFEDTVLVSGKPKNPDYSFRVGGTRKFFVEAKAPHVNVENSKEYAFQLKRYTWSGKLSVGLLTDFEELSIYVPKSAPKLSHHPKTDRIKYYKYTDYVENWEEIYNIYSKEAVLSGKFDNYFSDKDLDGKNPTSSVDSEFLKTIEEWRLILARNIALRNKELEVEELNYAVQLIIDRIIFLRIAEDRGIERYGKLKKLLDLAENNIDKCPVYEGFIELCKKADAKYNSGLFHFTEEEDITLDADILTPTLHVDDGTLKKIIKGLYYPDCPYEFSMISTEILGNIYEQFLGKVIRLTDAHHAKVEDKPEVKKAGGVFYTPQYIVDYIVENTIGELLKGKTPNKVSELRIVDPACGSGSFLLGAYQKLLDWHTDYYSNLEQPPKNVIYTDKKGIKRLTIQEKKRILLNNIYGVDIDSQAVEVTKLSLLLKVLEDENKDVLEQQQKLIQERALPFLGNNIRCGNSLIGTDILEEDDLTDEDISIINPFDWEEEFSEVFSNGGFDVVIGNPPYFNIDTWGIKSKPKEYIKKHYKNIWRDKTDILFYFIEKAISISKSDVGFIVSNAFLFADKSDKLRNFILDNAPIKKIVNFEGYKVFKDANISTCIIFLNNNKNDTVKALGLERDNYTISELVKILYDENNYFDLKLSKDDVFPIKNNSIMVLNKKIDNNYNKLSDLFYIGQGMQTGANNVYGFNEYPNQFPDEYIRKRVNVSDIEPYSPLKHAEYILYLEDVEKFTDLPDSIKQYLKSNSAKLKGRADKKRRKTSLWWNYTFALHKEYYNFPRIFTNYRNNSNKFTIDINKEFIGYTNSTVIFDTNEKINLKYLLTLLNSNVLNFRYKSIGKQTSKNTYEYFSRGLGKLPIPEISLEEQMPFIDLADKMLDLTNQLQNVKTPKQKGLLEKQIKVTDKKINQLVYELYELTDEEINIVENTIKE